MSIMTRAARTLVGSGATLVLMLTLTACSAGGDDDPASPDTTAGTDEAATSEDSADGNSSDSGEQTDGSGSDDAPGANSAVFDAIDLAEQDAGGTVFEVEHEDRPDSQGVWEIEVAVDDQEMELLINFEGTEVLDSKLDGTLGDEEREGLNTAEVGVADAIRTALEEVEGTFDEAELEREGDGFVWEIEIEQGPDDTEVDIDVVSGDVVRVDAD